jgi:GAF domain-containing protein
MHLQPFAEGVIVDRVDEVAAALAACLHSDDTHAERARRAAEAIRQGGGFDWVGLYDVLPEMIVAIAWTGREAPAHPTFPRTQGLNGAAVASRAPVVANDVACDPRYLTTFERTGAEMIVPVLDEAGEVVGTLDVESARVGAFGPAEQAWVVQCAALLRPLWP